MGAQPVGPGDYLDVERAEYIDALVRSCLPYTVKAVMYELVLRASFAVEPWEDPQVECVDRDVAAAVGLDREAVMFCLDIAEQSGYLRDLGSDGEVDRSWFELRNPEEYLLEMWQRFLAEHHKPISNQELFDAKLAALLAESAPEPEP
ncbi:hypothetical protein [Streptomyces platensis]|uniref:hypothetical protein n=1 Tax=Streptomyces platensis TaxID=58346 RepID=UPI001F3066D4|nr:hypothetical protein [Streptomyces platensis]MCF3143791.1 hypothetical protein [Streptomyces platensis]